MDLTSLHFMSVVVSEIIIATGLGYYLITECTSGDNS